MAKRTPMIARARQQSGFTLTELLVVLLIVGLLAAIAIPAFLSQQSKAADADAKAHARTAQLAAEAYATDGNGRYGGLTADALVEIEPTLAELGERLEVDPVSAGAGYEVRVTAERTGNEFRVERHGRGQMTYSCSEGGQGGCPDGGTWGGG